MKKRAQEILESYGEKEMDEILALFEAAGTLSPLPINFKLQTTKDDEIYIKASCISILEEKLKNNEIGNTKNITLEEIQEQYPPAYPNIKLII